MYVIVGLAWGAIDPSKVGDIPVIGRDSHSEPDEIAPRLATSPQIFALHFGVNAELRKCIRNCLARPGPVFQGKIEGSPLHMPKIGPWWRKKPLISWEKLGVDALNNYAPSAPAPRPRRRRPPEEPVEVLEEVPERQERPRRRPRRHPPRRACPPSPSCWSTPGFTGGRSSSAPSGLPYWPSASSKGACRKRRRPRRRRSPWRSWRPRATATTPTSSSPTSSPPRTTSTSSRSRTMSAT